MALALGVCQISATGFYLTNNSNWLLLVEYKGVFRDTEAPSDDVRDGRHHDLLYSGTVLSIRDTGGMSELTCSNFRDIAPVVRIEDGTIYKARKTLGQFFHPGGNFYNGSWIFSQLKGIIGEHRGSFPVSPIFKLTDPRSNYNRYEAVNDGFGMVDCLPREYVGLPLSPGMLFYNP